MKKKVLSNQEKMKAHLKMEKSFLLDLQGIDKTYKKIFVHPKNDNVKRLFACV